MDKGLANPICTERRGLVWPNIFLVTIFSSWFLNSMSWTLCTWFNDSDTWVSGSRRGRVVKASDLKSDSLWERRFESCRLRDFCKKNSHLHRLIMKSHNYHVCIVAVVAEWLRRLTRNQIPSGSVGSNPTDCARFFGIFFMSSSEAFPFSWTNSCFMTDYLPGSSCSEIYFESPKWIKIFY